MWCNHVKSNNIIFEFYFCYSCKCSLQEKVIWDWHDTSVNYVNDDIKLIKKVNCPFKCTSNIGVALFREGY